MEELNWNILLEKKQQDEEQVNVSIYFEVIPFYTAMFDWSSYNYEKYSVNGLITAMKSLANFSVRDWIKISDPFENLQFCLATKKSYIYK